MLVVSLMAFGVAIEELCPLSFYFYMWYYFGTYLDDDENIGVLVEPASCFCKSDLNCYVINKVFDYLNII